MSEQDFNRSATLEANGYEVDYLTSGVSPVKYEHLFEEVDGTPVLEELKRLFYDITSFSSDTNLMAFHEGQRSVLMFIQEKISRAKKEREYQIEEQQ